MKTAYPVVFVPAAEGGFTTYVPDFDINSQGNDLVEATEMVRDAIGIMGIDREDDGETIPAASSLANISAPANGSVSLVDIDFTGYRRTLEMSVGSL